ncbi:hypothetical protein AND_009976 [Anopheles darlingi]|uniref:Uncharacterized protein n=1 Tax=Anopheles darlingi TaxID=43151 RepID=W5J2G8_ANODA|nr:hypothetical protein AND_009976 [Anopheles darlingi]
MQANFVKPIEQPFQLDPRITQSVVLNPTDRLEATTENSIEYRNLKVRSWSHGKKSLRTASDDSKICCN